MKLIKILFFLSLILFFYSCATVKEGFINQRKNSSDEFLVEKKSPLVLPPEYNELLEPKDSTENLDTENKKIKEILINSDTKIDNKEFSDGDFEDKLIKKIKKN
tara:strand:+ start:11 stop:322 length:312 start_codon:yes stop_codon:yes gene_type:complete